MLEQLRNENVLKIITELVTNDPSLELIYKRKKTMLRIYGLATS
jgi:hypothetical protein